MSWESLFFLVLFVLVPLFQSLMERGKRPQQPPAEWEHGDGEPPMLPDVAPERLRTRGAGEPVAEDLPWWGPAPLEAPEDEAPNDPVPAPAEERWPARGHRAPPRDEEADLPVVVSLEPLAPRPEPDRALEHARLHRRVQESAVPGAAPAASPRLRLRGAAELRRAVVMAEVVGPPRALRPLDP